MALMYEGRASTRGVDADDVVVHPVFDEALRDDRAHDVHELDLTGFSRSKASSIALFRCEPECLAGCTLSLLPTTESASTSIFDRSSVG